MNSPHDHHDVHHPHHEHHDVHQQRLIWFFSFCNQRSSSSSSSSSSSTRRTSSKRKSASSRNKFAAQYQQQQRQQQRQLSNVFGCDLTEHTHLFSNQDSVPCIVKSCTKFIEKHGIIFGIYRLSGMRVNIHKLRQDFDRNPKISMIDSESISNDAHAVACVLKQYFRELPIPLLTFHMYERFIELFKQSNLNNNNNNDTNGNNKNTNNKDITDASLTKNRVSVTNMNSSDGNTNKYQDNIDASQPTQSPMTNKSKSTTTAPSSISSTKAQETKETQFATSASDSQLLSLSSVVTTTASDVRYHVKLDDLRRLLLQLPRPHYQTLKFLMRHLACIAANGEKTGMDSKNVAIVWAPNLLKPRELELSAGLETLQMIGLQAVITEQLIKHQKFLFDDYDDNDQAEGTLDKDKEPITGGDRIDNIDQDADSIDDCMYQQATHDENLPHLVMHKDNDQNESRDLDNQETENKKFNEENIP